MDRSGINFLIQKNKFMKKSIFGILGSAAIIATVLFSVAYTSPTEKVEVKKTIPSKDCVPGGNPKCQGIGDECDFDFQCP